MPAEEGGLHGHALNCNAYIVFTILKLLLCITASKTFQNVFGMQSGGTHTFQSEKTDTHWQNSKLYLMWLS